MIRFSLHYYHFSDNISTSQGQRKGAITMKNTNQTTKQNEYTTRKIYRDGEEIVIVERKQESKFYGAIEI
jgi:hypothetical protein